MSVQAGRVQGRCHCCRRVAAALLGSPQPRRQLGCFSGAGANPAHPPAGPRSYTPAVFPRYVNTTALRNTAPLTTCADARLTQSQRLDCLVCLAHTTRQGCLAQTSEVWYGAGAGGRGGEQGRRSGKNAAMHSSCRGVLASRSGRASPAGPHCSPAPTDLTCMHPVRVPADRESCTWVGRGPTIQTKFSIGVNVPYLFSHWLGAQR